MLWCMFFKKKKTNKKNHLANNFSLWDNKVYLLLYFKCHNKVTIEVAREINTEVTSQTKHIDILYWFQMSQWSHLF